MKLFKHSPSPALVIAVLALFVALAGTGVAATGGNFILGQSNSAGNTTALSSGVTTGPTLALENTGGKPAAKFTTNSGVPPFVVVRPVKVANLSSDLLDGLDSTGFWKLGGNAVGATGVLGTTTNQALDLIVNGKAALRLTPDAASPNLVGGFYANTVIDDAHGATVAGGGAANLANQVDDDFGTVGGGRANQVGSADGNPQSATDATIAGGSTNLAKGGASIGGGVGNTAGSNSTIAGGLGNLTYLGSAIGGGEHNKAGDTYGGTNSTIGGGASNFAVGGYSVVAGGTHNKASGGTTAVGGGQFNRATRVADTVGGGYNNVASGQQSVVGGGAANAAGGHTSTIAGGGGNTITEVNGFGATIAGGTANTANGQWSTVAGGANNTTGGFYSFAAGLRAKATNDGSFVWADDNDFDIGSYGANTFTARTTGGARFISAIDPNTGAPTAGVELAAGGGSWSSLSDRASKRDFTAVDGTRLLARLNRVPITRWSYKSQKPSIRHLGPTAQDFRAAFGLGEDARHIDTIDSEGVALAAIQGLYRQNQALERQNRALNARLTRLERAVAKLSH